MTKALIFDMDGTLTPSRHPVPDKVVKALKAMRGKYKLYLVTGSNFEKVEEQFGWGLSLIHI